MNIDIFTVIVGALVDSINPCAFAVLIYLIAFLTSISGSRKKLLVLGGLYILMVFAVYTLSGLGLLEFIYRIYGFVWFRYIYKGIGALVIIAGLINIKDFFLYGKGFSLAIPEGIKPLIEKHIKKATIPATFAVGLLVALFELPCSGWIYLSIISSLAKSAEICYARICLLVYNVVFVTPLVVLLLLGTFVLSSKKLEDWREKNRKVMRLLMGLVMVLLGSMMVLDII